jgi:hypothetical protein
MGNMHRFFPGGDLENVQIPCGQQELRLEDFYVSPEQARGVYIAGAATPKLGRFPVIGAFVNAHVEQAWLDGDDEAIRSAIAAEEQARS